MNSSVIGCGAAGTKGLITLLERGVITKERAHIVNSTMRDVPAEYRDIAIIISDDERTGGCGKEREAGKQLMRDYIDAGHLDPTSLIHPDDDTCTIIAAPEGGTGSGASIVLANELNEVLPVHIVMLNGFEDDARGIKNTVNYFKDLNEEFTVEAISNKKFLTNTGSRSKAELAANEELVNRMMVYLANPIVESTQNIDATDHYKVATTPGFTDIEYVSLDKIKNLESFEKLIDEMVDDTKSVDFTATSKIIGVYINASEKTADIITNGFGKIKERFGASYELFHHIQNEGGGEWVAIMASGIKLPIEEVEAIYDRYVAESNKVDKTKDSFFGAVSGMKDLDEDSSFNRVANRRNKMAGKKEPVQEQNNKPANKKGFSATVRLVEGDNTVDSY